LTCHATAMSSSLFPSHCWNSEFRPPYPSAENEDRASVGHAAPPRSAAALRTRADRLVKSFSTLSSSNSRLPETFLRPGLVVQTVQRALQLNPKRCKTRSRGSVTFYQIRISFPHIALRIYEHHLHYGKDYGTLVTA
jgi:hypothetical protein